MSAPAMMSVMTPVPAATPKPVPVPPVGARLFFGGEDGNPCLPEESFHWCWSGEPDRWARSEKWFNTKETGMPAHELAVRPDYLARCPTCAVLKLAVVWKVIKNGEKRLRLECGVCGRYLRALKLPPGNVDLEYRATAAR
jgi:hypothetical protein